jgi:uncharacterized integral membrane protein
VKHISWILTLPLTLVIIVFAVANRHFVPLDLWPLEIVIEAPVFVLVLGGMLTGFLAGALVMWLSGRKLRRRARAARGQLAKLEREVQRHSQDRVAAGPAPQGSAAATRPPSAVVRGTGGPGLPAA